MSAAVGDVRPSGALGLKLIKGPKPGRMSLWRIIADGFPHFGLSAEVNKWRFRNCRSLMIPLFKIAIINLLRVSALVPSLRLVLIRADGTILDYGLASLKVVTDAGVNYIVTCFLNTAEPENMKYHGFGTGTTAEATGDTALVTELTTQYAVDNTRPTGSQAAGASANIYHTVATLTPDSGGTIAVTEHGIFSATSGVTLLDRSKFSAVNVVASADSLQATYDLTFTSGG